VFDLATHVDKVDYDVTVLCGEGETLPKKLEGEHIRVIRLKSMQRDISIFKELKSFIELYKIFKQEKPDIIHLNSSKMGGSGAFIGRLAGVKNIIFTAHGFAFNEDRSFISKKLILFFHWLTILLTHKTIMVSNKTMKDIDYLPFMKNKLVKIYNGIDIGLDFYDKEKATRFLLKDKVFLLGRIENAYRYIKAADVFVLPSRTEAFPYVLLESGLAGACVLASNVGGISEVVEDDYNGVLFDVNDERDIVHKVNMLIENREMRDGFGKRVQEKVKGEFSLEKMVEGTEGVY
jgi:hypothetical protein